ncbi:MAG TPA: (2Fe-2S)-binding protein [Streptosporangiaceae bacterium]
MPLAELASLGPYFAVTSHDAGSPVSEPWQPLATLTGSPLRLRERIAEVRAALAAAAGCAPEAVEFRVAASVAQLGVAARLVSPALAVAALSAGVLCMDPAVVRWQPVLGGAFPLSLTASGGVRTPGRSGSGEDDALARELARQLVNGPVRAITEMTAAMSVSRRVVWGNVASAVNGAASMIAAARPSLEARAWAISSALLRHPPLAGGYEGAPGGGFRRRNCCLIYRIAAVPGNAICADCVLRPPTGPPR